MPHTPAHTTEVRRALAARTPALQQLEDDRLARAMDDILIRQRDTSFWYQIFKARQRKSQLTPAQWRRATRP